MPLLSLNAAGRDVCLPGGPDPGPALKAALSALAPGQPAVIMLHGYRFSPADPRHDPHRHILSAEPGVRHWKALPWPRHLGLATPCGADAGLGIGLGWEARGTIWKAWDAAEQAGTALAALVRRVRLRHDGPVSVLAHSLGARVALAALPLLDAGAIDRLVFLAAAEFRDHAAAARDSAAGASADFVNVTSRENDLFDALLERLMFRRPGTALATGGPRDPRWCDLALDAAETLAALRRLGYAIPGPQARLCHWSLYLRPGVFALYRDLLAGPARLPLDTLRAALPENRPPRWSRLLALPEPRAGLPLRRNAPS